MSNQGFTAVTRSETGPASVMTLAMIYDMSATSVDHHFVLSLGYPFEQFDMQAHEFVATTSDNRWKLRSIPRDSTTQVPRTLLTACRSGYFVKSKIEQSNVNQLIWGLPDDPKLVATSIDWRGAPVLHDSWAWAHFLHAIFAGDVLFHVIVLLVLTYRNLRVRTYWIGDAFVAISSSLVLRGFLVVASMVVDKFYALQEFCMHDASVLLSGAGFMYPEMTQADLLAIYLSLVGLLGKLVQARLDPALSLVFFELGFHLRYHILAWLPPWRDIVVATGMDDFVAGIVVSEDDSSIISPMKLWGPHKLQSPSVKFFGAALFPIFATLLPLLLIELVRTRIKSQSQQRTQHHTAVTPFSTRESRDNETLRTNFELATGARLADRFGLVGDYDNYMYVKGLRFASADGIYSNGFVIVNNKFLVQTEDLLTIAIMKLVRFRFRNVYAYDVHEHSVGEMARLVYPDTMTFRDLIHINLKVLT